MCYSVTYNRDLEIYMGKMKVDETEKRRDRKVTELLTYPTLVQSLAFKPNMMYTLYIYNLLNMKLGKPFLNHILVC